MWRSERLHSFFIVVIIVLSVPTFFTELIPYPYDWLVKLVSNAITRILLIVPLIMLFSNKGVKLFFYASLLLIPQAISDCGILHSEYAWFRSYESVYDWSITALIAALYGRSLYHLIKSLINK